MIKYEGIKWPTDISNNLVSRIQQSTQTSSLPVAIATEIYNVGVDHERVFFENYKKDGKTSDLLKMSEANGYLRIGHEVLFFQEPDGIYVPIKEFIYGSKSDKITTGPWIDLTPVVSDKYFEGSTDSLKESQLTSMEIDETLKNSSIIDRKIILLREEDPHSLLMDLRKEANEEYTKRKISSPYDEFDELWNLVNPMEHIITGIGAAILRYEQLLQHISKMPDNAISNDSPTAGYNAIQERSNSNEIRNYIPNEVFYLTYPISRVILSSIGTKEVRYTSLLDIIDYDENDIMAWLKELSDNNILVHNMRSLVENPSRQEAHFSMDPNMLKLFNQLNLEFSN